MSLGSQIGIYRKKQGITQSQLAEAVSVSFQSVSAWERDEYQPDIAHLKVLAKTLHTTVGTLIEEYKKPSWTANERYFDENHMFTFVRSAALAMGLTQTLQVMPHVKCWHDGQLRDGVQTRISSIRLRWHVMRWQWVLQMTTCCRPSCCMIWWRIAA